MKVVEVTIEKYASPPRRSWRSRWRRRLHVPGPPLPPLPHNYNRDRIFAE